jgi:hypothetical protein
MPAHFSQDELVAGLPDFSGTIYQNCEKYTKRTQNVPNGHGISPMSVNYSQAP